MAIQCSSCGETKPIAVFCKDSRNVTGVSSTCLECFNKKRRETRTEKSAERSASPPLVDGVRFLQMQDHPEYWIGTDGSVWGKRLSRDRVRKSPRKLQGKVCDNGYIQVQVYSDDGVSTALVHRLVLEAFVGPCPDGMECLHEDNNRQNNRLENIRWGTHSENVLHQRKCGTLAKQRLDENEVALMKVDRLDGLTYREIAEKRGIHETTAHDAINGRTWK